MIEKDKIYRMPEIVELTGLSAGTIMRRIKSKHLKTVSEPNEHIRIWGSELLRFLGKEDR
jgi:predicted DNA-binding transcriptional regulator AlpA